MKIGPSTCPMKMVAATASAGGPRRPRVRRNTAPNASVAHFSTRQCHSRAERAQITRITGSTRKPSRNGAAAGDARG